jgi:hypothetical protein
MRMHRSSLILLVALASAPSVHAQWSPDATMDLGVGYGQMTLSQSSLQGTRSIGMAGQRAFAKGKGTTRAPNASLPPSRAADLRYVPSPKVTGIVNQRFIDWQSAKRPQMRAQLAKGINSGELQGYFRNLVTQRGFSPTDLADVSTVYYISLWQVLHGREVTARQAAGVRRQMREAMGRDPRLTSLPDAQQQEIAETFALHTALALQGYQQLLRSGNAALLRDFRSGLQRKLVPQGPDLMSLHVTDEGFVRR